MKLAVGITESLTALLSLWLPAAPSDQQAATTVTATVAENCSARGVAVRRRLASARRGMVGAVMVIAWGALKARGAGWRAAF